MIAQAVLLKDDITYGKNVLISSFSFAKASAWVPNHFEGRFGRPELFVQEYVVP